MIKFKLQPDKEDIKALATELGATEYSFNNREITFTGIEGKEAEAETKIKALFGKKK